MSEMVIKFRCLTCMAALPQTEVTVRCRHPNEDLRRWMEKVVKPKVAASHQLLAPHCQSLVVDLAVPVANGVDARLGMAGR